MLTGRKSVAELEARAAVMPDLDTEPAVFTDAEILTIIYEIAAKGAQDVLPPGLHPTIPPLVTFVVWRCLDSPWGAFSLAQTRIECRSGARPRAFVVGAVVDSSDASEALRTRWGFPCRAGSVSLERSYDRIAARVVTSDGGAILDVEAVDPVPLRPSDIQWIANMHIAHTPRGARLVQIDPEFDVSRAERAHPELITFDGGAWGDENVAPVYPVAASFAVATITLPRIRFLCAPDQPAFFATEVIG